MATALEEIFADNAATKEWAPSATDLESWVTVGAADIDGEDDTTVTLVGLFGGDLSGFLEDCAAAEEGDCDEADYAGLSGWAFGIEWTPAEAEAIRLRQANDGDVNTLVFADRLIAAAIGWVDGEHNILGTLDVDIGADEITADAPNAD